MFIIFSDLTWINNHSLKIFESNLDPKPNYKHISLN